MRLEGPVAAVIITIVIVVGALFGSGALTPEKPTYATVHYEGGWTKIGVIRQERIFSEVSLTREEESVFNGSIAEFKSFLEASSAASGGTLDTPLSAGFIVSARAGIRWLATERSFDLTTENYNSVSTKTSPIIPKNLINDLEALKSKAISERGVNSLEAIKYGPKPEESFFWSKLLELIETRLDKF
jgi:3-oxoacyl-ACP reductase-like protein